MMDSIIITGARCTGKTTKGQIIADKLNIPLVDGDAQINRYLLTKGYDTISDFVEKKGWEEFREIETGTIEQVCEVYCDRPIVFTPGGGAVAHDQGEGYRRKNVNLLRELGTIFYIIPYDGLLQNSVELAYRVVNDSRSKGQRPKLTDVSVIDDPIMKKYIIEFSHSYINLRNKKIDDVVKATSEHALKHMDAPDMPDSDLKFAFDIIKTNQATEGYVKEFIDMYKTLKKRDSLYREAAHHTILTKDSTNEEAAKMIIEKLV